MGAIPLFLAPGMLVQNYYDMRSERSTEQQDKLAKL